MYFKPRRKRNVYTSPNDKLKAVERVVFEGVSTRIIERKVPGTKTILKTYYNLVRK